LLTEFSGKVNLCFYGLKKIFVSDTAIDEQQPAPGFTLPAVGSDDVVKNGLVQLPNITMVLWFNYSQYK